MELFGAISSGDQWRSSDLNGIYSSDNHDYHHFIMSSDNSDDHHVLPNYDLNHISSLEIPFTIWPNCDSTIVHDSISSANMFLNIGNCDHNINHDHWPINVNAQLQVNEEESDMIALSDQPTIIGLGSLNSGNISKKRARASTIANDDQDSKSMRNVKPKKSQKSIINDELEDVNEDMKGPISPNSPLLSDSNASHEELGGTVLSTSSPKGTALNLNGKTRASRGSATDPQSVYARKRREKINERLRTLQNLVPNGTKVDISTMLEEAVQYVKFLQLQIKLLSSDDLWMYAPLAYNGMGIGLDLGLNSPKL